MSLIEKVLYADRMTVEQLLKIWEESVRATHTFLKEEDIQALKRLAEKEITQSRDLYVAKYPSSGIAAFMGLEKDKVVMLFVSAQNRGKGLGRNLLTFAINAKKIKFVDVNEQNSQAVGFYEHLGFKTFQRSELDEQGMPFPILHMSIVDSI